MKNLFLINLFILAASLQTFSQGYVVGDKAENFKLKNVDGEYISLYNYTPAEKGAIVIFTCNHCPFAIAYEDRIIEIDQKFRSKGYPVISVNPNDPKLVPEDSFEKMQVRAQEKNFPFPYLMDKTQEIYKMYGAKKTPHVYLLKKENGDFIVSYIGTIDDNYKNASAVEKKYLNDAVTALINGKKPNPDFTKAIGCTIKDKDYQK